MNEYVITFINDSGVYQELTFRGVSQAVATAIAEGLNREPFQAVSLQQRDLTPIPLSVTPFVPVEPLPDLPPVEPAPEPEPEPAPAPDEGVTGGTEPMAKAKTKK